MKKNWSVKNKVVVVTGGTKGIGKAIVEEFIEFEAEVIFIARSAEDISNLEKQLNNTKNKVKGIVADLSDKDERVGIIEKINEQHKVIDVLVNNIGTNIRKPITDYTDREIQHIFNTNLFAMLDLSRKFYPFLKKSEQANIINISSVAGITHLKTGAVYAMTKAAINQLTKNLAVEWAKDNIRVNSIVPWYINTPLANTVLKNETYKKQVLNRTPLERIGEPHEVASLAVYLCMPAANFITGQSINIDGGFSIYGF